MLLHLTWNQSFSLCSEKQDSLWCIKYKGGKMWTILPSSGVRFCIPTFPHPSPPPNLQKQWKRKKMFSLSGAGPSQANYGPESFYYLCNAKTQVSSSPAPGTERALFCFLWAKQLWWILNPLMAGKAKTNVQAWLQLELLDVLAPFSSFPPEEAKHAEHQRCHLGLVSSAIWEFLPCWGTSGAANF